MQTFVSQTLPLPLYRVLGTGANGRALTDIGRLGFGSVGFGGSETGLPRLITLCGLPIQWPACSCLELLLSGVGSPAEVQVLGLRQASGPSSGQSAPIVAAI